MFALHVRTRFCAAHALVFRGVLEPLHWHDWCVEAVVVGESLDEDGVLCDFHEVEADLAKIIAPFQNANLNTVPPFGSAGAKPDLNPSAEHVARHIGESLRLCLETRVGECPKTTAGAGAAARVVRVESVSVTEAEGCLAVYRL